MHAVAHPNDLPAEKLDAVAFDRLQQIVAEQASHPIDLNRLTIGYQPPAIDGAETLPGELLLEAFEARLAPFDEARCATLAARIFPNVRRLFSWWA